MAQRRLTPVLFAAVSVALTLAGRPACAQEPEERSLVEQMSLGFHLSVAPGVFFQSGGNAGFALEVRGRYGIKAGPVVIAPGADAIGLFPSGTAVIVGMPTVTVLLPIGPAGPYVFGGVGGGTITATGNGGLAPKAGGGIIVIPIPDFGFGVEVSHMGIVDTGFEVTSIAPYLFLAL